MTITSTGRLLTRLGVTGARTEGAEPSVHAQYLYDAAGERVKKLVRRPGGAVEVTTTSPAASRIAAHPARRGWKGRCDAR